MKNFKLKQGMNTIFSGPLGSGKTGIFRLLFGVWPLSEGTLTRPSLSKILYINSKFYMPKGNLRDLIIYPDSIEEMNLMTKGSTMSGKILEFWVISPKIKIS